MTELFSQSVQAMVGDKAVAFSALEHEGEIFLVLKMSSNPSLGLQRVDLMFPLSKVAHQTFDDPKAQCRWFVNDPLPAKLFGDPSPLERELYGVRGGPDVTFPLPAKH
jgi:hypothetical protein